MKKSFILIFIFSIFNLIAASPITRTSKVTVNLVKPIILEVNDIDFGIYFIGQPAPKPKNVKIILKGAEPNRDIKVSIPPSLTLSSTTGNDHPELYLSLSKYSLRKTTGSILDPETTMTVTFKTLPKVPGEYIGTVTITADYN